MGGGNAQKSATARERNLEKARKAKGGVSQLEANKKASSIVVSVVACYQDVDSPNTPRRILTARDSQPGRLCWALTFAPQRSCSAKYAAQPSSARPR